MRRVLVSAIAVIVSLLIASPAGADLSSDLDEVSGQIDELEAAIDAAQGARTDFAASVLETARQLEIVAAELLESEERLADTDAAIVSTEALLVDLAEIITAGALRRTESRGGHSRMDYPKRDDAHWLHHTIARAGDDGPVLSERQVTITDYEPRERTY